MWIVVGMANSLSMAKNMQSVLEDEGVLVKIRDLTDSTKRSRKTIEVLVLESELDSAREILLENGF
jgi:uncharacterized membrane protein